MPSKEVISAGKGGRSSKTKKKVNNTPLCLWSKHKEEGIMNYFRDCEECPKEEKDKIFDAFRKVNTAGVKRSVRKAPVEESAGILFSDKFGEKFCSTVCNDNGADANILDIQTITKLKNSGVDLTAQTLPRPRMLHMPA